MKTFVIALLSFYQTAIDPFLHTLLGTKSFCRFTPSCSAYTKHMIAHYGVIIGIRKGIRRLLSCQPFAAIH